MKHFAVLSLGLALCTAQAGEEPKKKTPCPTPLKGPVWLQDFTDVQKTELHLKWKTNEEDDNVEYRIEGKYHEPLDTSRTYSRYKHVSEIDAKENWVCGKDLVPVFKSIAGTVESDMEWRSETVDTKETYEGENHFEIKAPDDYRHVRHESERKIEVRNEILTRDYEEETDWKQVWEKDGTPVIKGTVTEKSTEKSQLAGETRQLASPILVPGFDAAPLASGIQLVIEKEAKGKLNGPIDPVSIKTKQTVKQIKDEKVVQTKEIQIDSNSEYKYDPKGKKYDFVTMSELYDEKSVSAEAGVKVHYARLDTWNNPEKPPVKSSFWKETYRKTKFGGSAEIILNSDGHGFMPKVGGLQAKEGTYSRITDYNSSGRITRFLVMYFPKGEKQNKTVMDLHFTEMGQLREFTVLDDEINSKENPMQNPAALFALQNRVNELKVIESFASLKALPERKNRDADYPVIYQPLTE